LIYENFGLWLSLVERCVRDAEAVGSNPTSPISSPPKLKSPHGFPSTPEAVGKIKTPNCAIARRSKLQPAVLDGWIDNCSYGLSQETTQSEDFETQAAQAHEGEPA
jgi:hypothetical protein